MKDYKIQIAGTLRKEQTLAETALWKVLRDSKFKKLKFKRHHSLKDYIVAFYCEALELVIELDGDDHTKKEQKAKDVARDYHLSFLGYSVLRYQNEKVFNNLDSIFKDILLIKEQTEEHFKKTGAGKKHKLDLATASSQQERAGVRESVMINILSTKKLKPSQRDLLLGAGFSVVDYDAINVAFLEFEIPTKIKNAIFTSQNGVYSFFNELQTAPISVEEKLGIRIFCVGQKTKALLEDNGLKVTKMASNSVELGNYIVENYKNDSFHYFCGAQRREELPAILNSNEIKVSEVKTYKTVQFPKKFKQKWNAILFFSPSGVSSYFNANQDNMGAIAQRRRNDFPLLICIGETTAAAAKKYSDTIVVANTTSVESVIAKAVKKLNEIQ